MTGTDSRQPSGSGHRSGSGSSRKGSRPTRGVCTFWLDAHCFGLDIEVVTEVVSLTDMLEVPLVPPGVLGVFSLRGTPVALVDPTRVLDLPERPQRRSDAARTALVLRIKGMVAALAVDRVDGVVSAQRGTYLVASDDAEHAAVQGFLETEAGRVITLISPDALRESLERLRTGWR